MKKQIGKFWNGYILLRRLRQATFSCGHRLQLQGKNERFSWDFSPARAKIGICLDCHLSKAIPCCLCGKEILPGSSVALYSNKTPNLYEGSVEVGENVIGCMRWDCCPSGGFFAGRWTKDGFRPEFEDGVTVVAEVMRTGDPVIVEHL